MWLRFRKFFTLVCCLLAYASCSRDTDERAIRETLEQMRLKAEAKEFEATLEPVSADYNDNLGQNRKQVRQRLERVFGGYDRLDIRLAIDKIERKNLKATVHAKIKIIGQSGDRQERLIGSPLAAKELLIYFEKRTGQWKVVGSAIEFARGGF